MYEVQDFRKAMGLWKTIPYHTETQFKDFSLYIKDAGHILGSSMFQFTFEGKKIVFTGDLGNSPTPLLKDTESIEGANYVVMESVYGDRNHESKDERSEKFKKIIIDTLSRGGTLVIPAFSLERTQVIIYEINKLVEAKAIPSVPVYIDSPLATRVTDVYKGSTHLFNDRAQAEIKAGDDLFNFPRLMYTASMEESREIDHSKQSKIIIAGSGMSIGGRVRHHEQVYLPDPNSTVLLVGYQTLGSVGRYLLDGAKKVVIDKGEVKVRAHIESILGFSSHKDSDHLVEFAATAQKSAKTIFVAMGEPKASAFLAQRINNETGIKSVCPERGVPYELR
jgi:metallo-beta-lactamase family protein